MRRLFEDCRLLVFAVAAVWPAVGQKVCEVIIPTRGDGFGEGEERQQAPPPVRFGVPLRPKDLEHGLRLEGAPVSGALQWELLPMPPNVHTGRVWVEVTLTGVRGRVWIARGGVGAQPAVRNGQGRLVTRRRDEGADDAARTTTTEWRWAGGQLDTQTRTRLLQQLGGPGVTGETRTVETDRLERQVTTAVIPSRWWRRAGVLPRDLGLAAGYRAALAEAVPDLPEAPGPRGRGDYVRGPGGETVTNHEFDTILGLVRLALAQGDPALLRAARRAAWHLVDIDFDPGSGLVYRHGPGHRVRRPEPGHVWITGLCTVGAVTADRELLAVARAIANALADRFDPRPDGPYHARDVGWPLLELEFAAEFFGDLRIAHAASRFADKLLSRFDARAKVFRFEEGAVRGGGYRERGWITGGILLPALRAYVRRTGDRRAADVIGQVERHLQRQIRQAGGGLPTHWFVGRDGRVRSRTRVRGTPEAWMLLEGLSPRAQRALVGRDQVTAALGAMPREHHEDRATDFSMVARCWWVMR